MIFTIYNLNRNKHPIKLKEIDINRFEKIGLTGNGLALKYKKGITIIIALEYIFDYLYTKPQKQNYEDIKNRHYSYIRIDKNKPDHPKNRVRDSKGRPIKNYVKPVDYYIENEVNKIRFISDEDFKKVYEKAKELGILYEWFEDEFIEEEI
jgi:hypothetical protein